MVTGLSAPSAARVEHAPLNRIAASRALSYNVYGCDRN